MATDTPELPEDARRFRALRERLGWSRQRVVRFLDLGSETTVANWESGANKRGVPPFALAMLEAELERIRRTVPILGRIRAGTPDLAQQRVIGEVEWDRTNPGDVYALRVEGDSMVNSHILDGDLIFVKRGAGEVGDIVVALIGDEATVKRLVEQRGRRVLLGDHGPVPIPRGEKPVILGKFLGLRRNS